MTRSLRPAHALGVVTAALAVIGAGAVGLLRIAPPAGLLRTALVIAGALTLASFATGIVWSEVARRGFRPLVDALQRVAAGEPGVRLTDAPGPLAASRASSLLVQDALDRATGHLAQADARRRLLFADLAHEIATPTSALLGLADTLGRPELIPTEAIRARLLRAVEDEAERIGRLIDDLRDLAELDDPDVPLAPERVDLAALAHAAAARFDRDGPPIQVEAAPAWAWGDAARIDQVLANLLVNARRHAPTGEVALAVRAAAGGAEIVVEDSGPGVPDEALPQLGVRLRQLDAGSGARPRRHGLGLAIVRAVVRKHGGALTFDRSPRGGLRVTILLPAGPA
jgi:signal transduction histidine kinase